MMLPLDIDGEAATPDDLATARPPASYLLEDVLVARERFKVALRRTTSPGHRRRMLSRSKEALADRHHHGEHLAECLQALAKMGGEGSVVGKDRRIARRVARMRLKSDRAGATCLCCKGCDRRWVEPADLATPIGKVTDAAALQMDAAPRDDSDPTARLGGAHERAHGERPITGAEERAGHGCQS